MVLAAPEQAAVMGTRTTIARFEFGPEELPRVRQPLRTEFRESHPALFPAISQASRSASLAFQSGYFFSGIHP
jgi:hypothetical protein